MSDSKLLEHDKCPQCGDEALSLYLDEQWQRHENWRLAKWKRSVYIAIELTYFALLAWGVFEVVRANYPKAACVFLLAMLKGQTHMLWHNSMWREKWNPE